MCYDIELVKRRKEKIDKRHGEITYPEEANNLPARVSGFANAKVPVLVAESPYQIQLFHWGFVPKFAKDAKEGELWKKRSLNCRADTLRQKLMQQQGSMFKEAVNKPCVFLISGFCESHTLPDGKTKIPYFISLKDGETFAVAGITSTWRDFADGSLIHHGASLCTTSANEMLGFIHNQPRGSEDFRMPAILLPEEINAWLDGSLSADERLSLIKPYPQEDMVAYTVASFKKKEWKHLAENEVLEPFDYGIATLPTHIYGAP